MSNSVFPSAGVYTSETDLSLRVKGVSTSIGAICGASSKGPVNERVLVTDTTELELIFGTPNAKNYGFMLYCANAFMDQSERLYVTRVANKALTAGAFLTVDDPASSTPILSLTNFDDGSNNPLGVEDPENNLYFNVGDKDLNSTLMYITATNPGVWNNKISLKVKPSNPLGSDVGVNHNTRYFYIEVYYEYTGPNNIPVERFLVSRKLGEVDGNGKPLYVEDVINKHSNYISVRNNVHCVEHPILTQVFEFLGGGSDGELVTNDHVVEAWDLYDDPEVVDVNILINGGYVDPNVHRKMDSIAQMRQDAVAVLDLPYDDYQVAEVINFRRNMLNLNSSYSALYGPWLKTRDTFNNRIMYVPPSGHVAGTYAHTDTVRSVWFAPAGIQRGSLKVLGLKKKYNQGHRDSLDLAQVNTIRYFPGRGYVVWGQETLQSHDSALSNVNVRRLINYIKKSVAIAARTGVFDPNDRFLRLHLKSIAESFLEPIKNGRGLYDYVVVCDSTNNKPETIANGDLMLDVFADPVIPAKRIHLTAFIQPTGSYFKEN